MHTSYPFKPYFWSMNFSYFNFWVRNSVLYTFFCLLGLTMVLLDKNSDIHQEGNVLKVLLEGLVIVFIAHAQVFVHNVILYQKYFGKNNLKYIFVTLVLSILYFLINYFTPFGVIQSKSVVTMGISIFMMYLIGLGFYYIHKNILERNLLFQTELIERDEEIRHLKAQLNPHFLFNALNNLYGTALTDPAETPDKILELSELLRYQIESSKKEKVKLKYEIDFIKKYFSYEQNRNMKLRIDFETNIMSDEVYLPPMMFMPFIENGIKYSCHNDEPFLSLNIRTDKKKLTFEMKNNFNEDKRKFTGTNTGISNTRKRLELMYQNKHQLLITETDEIYLVELTINL